MNDPSNREGEVPLFSLFFLFLLLYPLHSIHSKVSCFFHQSPSKNGRFLLTFRSLDFDSDGRDLAPFSHFRLGFSLTRLQPDCVRQYNSACLVSPLKLANERTNEREWTKAQFTGAIKSRCIGNGMELAVMKFRRRLACPMPPRSPPSNSWAHVAILTQILDFVSRLQMNC